VLACRGDRVRAARRYGETLEWRKRMKVQAILSEPQPHFHAIKQYYPHFLHGRSHRGELVVYEFPGT
jgi:hypothetical protein